MPKTIVLSDEEIALLRTSRGLDHVATDELDAVIEQLAPTVAYIVQRRLDGQSC